MDINDLNRRIRYALSLDDAATQALLTLGGYPSVELEQIAGWRLKETDVGYQACSDDSVLALLDGLILDRRGPRDVSESLPTVSDKVSESMNEVLIPPKLDNNIVLKQLRIALSLRTDDVYALISAGGGKIGKTEVSAFFRKTTARNYRRCGDQVMRNFLSGVSSQQRDS